MKFYFIFNVILVVLYTTFAKNIQNDNEKDGGIKTKRDVETSDECKYINVLYRKDESFNCCTIIKNSKECIVCEDGHIVEM